MPRSFFENSSPELKFARRIQDAVDLVVHASTVGLLAAELNAVMQMGEIAVVTSLPHTDVASGVLFTPDSKVGFLVTAEHVVADFRQPGKRIQIAFGSEPRALPLDRDDGIATDSSNDIAVLRLRNDQMEYMQRARAAFLNLDGVLFDADLEGWYCLLSGKLAEGTRHSNDRHTVLFPRHSEWLAGGHWKVNSSKYDPVRHLLVAYSRNSWSFSTGLPTLGPKSLTGMSGTTLWRVFHESHLDLPWDINVLRSVGVQTHVYERDSEHLVQCSKWRCIIPLVLDLYPHARRSLPPEWLNV